MKTTYHLAVDLGATSGRTILAKFNGEKVETEELTRFKYPMLPIAGHLFWNLPFLYQEILKALKLTGERLGKELENSVEIHKLDACLFVKFILAHAEAKSFYGTFRVAIPVTVRESCQGPVCVEICYVTTPCVNTYGSKFLFP